MFFLSFNKRGDLLNCIFILLGTSLTTKRFCLETIFTLWFLSWQYVLTHFISYRIHSYSHHQQSKSKSFYLFINFSEREDCCKLTKKWIPHQKNFYFLLAGKCPYPSSICLNQVFWEHLIYHIATCVGTEEPSDMGYQQTLMYGRYSKAERPIKPPSSWNISPNFTFFYGRVGQLWSRPWGLWLRKKPGNRSWLREKSQKKCDGDGWV